MRSRTDVVDRVAPRAMGTQSRGSAPFLKRGVALLATVCFGFSLQAAAPLEIWPPQVVPLDKTALKMQLDALDSAATSLPDPLKPAVQFQKLFLQIVSGVAPSQWRGGIEKFASAQDAVPVTAGLREVSRAWLARLQMTGIDTVLRNYYRHNVRFPAMLAEIENDIPNNLRKDPWGEAWIYKPRAPQGFERLATQRYELGPTRFPQLGALDEASRHRNPQAHAWTIALRDVAGNKALEFRVPSANASVAIIQPGGKAGDCTLLYIGENWALMAGADQLFAVNF